MIKMEAPPLDRDVTVTVSLPFNENELKRWLAEGNLCTRLGAAFTKAIVDGYGPVYRAAEKL